MESIKTLVVFYSRTGTTKKIANKIKDILNCDIEEIVDTKNRNGVLGYILSGRDAIKKKQTIIKPIIYEPSKYDLVIIGTPVWAWTISNPIRTYISQNTGKFKNVKLFITCGAKGNDKIFTEIEDIIGLESIAKMELDTKQVKKNEYKNELDRFINSKNNKSIDD